MGKIRYYNDNNGIDAQKEKKALLTAIVLAKELGNIRVITILVHTNSNTDFIDRILGSNIAKKMRQGIKIDGCEQTLKIETINTITDLGNQDRVLLSYGLDSKELFCYDDFYNYKAIVAHQGIANGLEKWAKNWGAKNMETGNDIQKTGLPEKVILNAFAALTQSINMGSNIFHDSDDKLCKTYLRALHKFQYRLDPDQIYALLTRELDWTSRQAGQIMILVNKINHGKSFQGGDKAGLNKHIERWKNA